ncbi:carbohydrate ABC transporter permease [Acutalibacter sp. 1XD8-36]|uniref:carbohydrate ABC transporter permease n=1 Tax=Acutalibacter sp. 1XD8-36 TaxID=2320852 RepID=UPI00262B6DA0|nr:carbohydrate ABC transporter permease [Acutalibacter sp. 1XD8-36]
MVTNKSFLSKLCDIIIYFILAVICLICLVPLVNTLALSFSSSSAANAGKVLLWPVDPTLASYEKIISDSAYIQAIGVSCMRVLVGTSVSFAIIVTMAYPLSKSAKTFRFRNVYMWAVISTMLFSGGLIPLYMMVYHLKLINSFWSLILPCAVPVFNVILVMNYMKGLPKSVEESAELDGAKPWTILLRIVMPMCKPVLATVTLFTAVGHWNQYFDGMIYLNSPSKWPVQTYIQSLQTNLSELSTMTDPEEIARLLQVSGITFNAAKVFVALLPVIIVFPFVQKYFIGGIVLGAVKE